MAATDEDRPDRALIDACDRYLSRTRSSLWGRSHNVIHPAERRQAAEWLAQQVEAVQAELDVPVTNGKVT